MSDELLKALRNLPPAKEKKHFVNIEGKKYQVSLQKKLEIMKHGEENYIFKDNELQIKTQKAKTRYSVLKQGTRGYSFEQNDIHWPNDIIDGGEAWLIEYE